MQEEAIEIQRARDADSQRAACEREGALLVRLCSRKYANSRANMTIVSAMGHEETS
jgi:hypothetical protein